VSEGAEVLGRCGLLSTGVVLLCLAGPARAADDGLQPFVGDAILDSEYDLPALRRTLGLSLAIQSGRQGLGIGFHLAAGEGLQSVASNAPHPLAGAAVAARRAHRVGAVLAGAGLGLRTAGAVITFSARTLGGGLAGFGPPFLLGAAVDGAAAVNALSAGIRLRRARLAAGPLDNSFRTSCLLSEWTFAATGILSALSTVTQLLVGIAASDFAAYELRRGKRSRPGAQIRLRLAPTSLAISGRY